MNSRVHYFSKICREISVSLTSEKNERNFYEDLCTFMIISGSVIVKMRNVSEKVCRGNQNSSFMFKNVFPKIVPYTKQ
jgi:hypothetical protein